MTCVLFFDAFCQVQLAAGTPTSCPSNSTLFTCADCSQLNVTTVSDPNTGANSSTISCTSCKTGSITSNNIPWDPADNTTVNDLTSLCDPPPTPPTKLGVLPILGITFTVLIYCGGIFGFVFYRLYKARKQRLLEEAERARLDQESKDKSELLAKEKLNKPKGKISTKLNSIKQKQKLTKTKTAPGQPGKGIIV